MQIATPFDGRGQFFRGNLHTHSTRSDGRLDPDVVCEKYRAAGYDFLALTDHFLPTYQFPITDTAAFRTARFTTILGAEVHAPATSLGELWHILAVGLPQDFPPTGEGETAVQLAERCAATGAFVAIAHPAWYGLSVEDAETIRVAHAVEVYNHTGAVRTDRGDGWGLLDQLLARGRRLSACANDDAHFHVDDAFGGWVMVKAAECRPDLLVAALKAGRYYSTQGPAIESIAFDANWLEVECSPARAVMALGRGSKAASELGPGLRKARFAVDRFRQGGFVRVVVIDEAGKRAWSNPIWFDGAGG